MTALVGILNRRAAVLAANSAVTVTNGDKRKIYNTATKIFPLSAHKPVGVMIYSSDNYMGVPWDVIINLYSERFGTKSFETLEGYANNFINFLSSEKCFNEQDRFRCNGQKVGCLFLVKRRRYSIKMYFCDAA